ncbi:MAG: PhoPQ-activated protein PqaA family protein [Pirellulales bacterium]
MSITSAVVGRHIFYDNSSFDGNTPGVNAAGDNNAIAPDKSALLGNLSLAGPANVTSYSRGINGIAVDITDSHPGITESDFLFKVGSNNSPGSWAIAPDPAQVVVLADGGVGGSDRVEIIWDDNLIDNAFLQVIVAANDNTGLAASDVFFFGNQIGDTFGNTLPTNFLTNAADEIEARNNSGFGAPITNVRDFDRNSIVNANDQIIARGNAGFMSRIAVLVSPPALAAELSVDTGPDGQLNDDGITIYPGVQGTLTAATMVASFKAGLNSGPVTFDALPYLSGGIFVLDSDFVEMVNGGPLADGPYVVHLKGIDMAGLNAAAEVAFSLKTYMTPPQIPDLVAADDTGASSTDNLTKITTPRIDVAAEMGSLVRLYVDASPVDEGTGGPGLQFTLAAPLADGPHNIHVVSQDGAGNSTTSPTLVVTVRTVLPAISASTIATISADLTPHVTVAASSPLGLANGTLVTLDVDLNYDGNFGGAGETARTTSTLYNGGSYFQVTPALPHDVSGAAYNVQLRVRVTDIAGNEGTSTPIALKIDSIGNTVLDAYVTSNPFRPYTFTKLGGGTTGPGAYIVDLRSSTWRSLTDVFNPLWPAEAPEWRHWMQVIIPSGPIENSALLYITSGNNSLTAPTSADAGAVTLAGQLHAVVALLPTVPNQWLDFANDAPGVQRREDAIIAYSFNEYVAHFGEPGNGSWPALLPMVQSAVAAMDVVQDLVPDAIVGADIDDFVVTGYSKRGWTTWLTAAMDDRVRAIVPGVIDVLNMGEQMVHHYGYGYTGPGSTDGFSSALNDYLAFDIPQESYEFGGQEIGRVVDPYAYLDNGRFDDLPKLLINSAGDEFFVPDSAQYYFSDIPGTQNYLRYIPNTGHGLNSTDPTLSTRAFFDAVVNGNPLPQFSWTVGQDGSINVQTVTSPIANGVKLWQANSASRDFRKSVTNPTWTSSTLTDQGGGTYVGNVTTPGSGATAYFVELTFDNPVADVPDFVFTTEIRLATNIPLVPWAFFMPTIPPPAGESAGGGPAGADLDAVVVGLAATVGDGAGSAGSGAGGLDAVAVSLAMPASGGDFEAAAQSLVVAPAGAASPASAADVDRALASDWSWLDDDDDEPPADDEADELALILVGDDWL